MEGTETPAEAELMKQQGPCEESDEIRQTLTEASQRVGLMELG